MALKGRIRRGGCTSVSRVVPLSSGVGSDSNELVTDNSAGGHRNLVTSGHVLLPTYGH